MGCVTVPMFHQQGIAWTCAQFLILGCKVLGAGRHDSGQRYGIIRRGRSAAVSRAAIFPEGRRDFGGGLLVLCEFEDVTQRHIMQEGDWVHMLVKFNGFVDPDARFLFVSPAEVLGVAGRFGATPFEVEDVHFSRRGPKCTFDTMQDEFALHSAPLDRLAQAIPAADTNTDDASPQADGVLAISVGLSRQFKDDSAQLDAGLAIYDALYRGARDGQGEGHDWPAGRSA